MPRSAALRRGAGTLALPVRTPVANLRCTSVQFPASTIRYNTTSRSTKPFPGSGPVCLRAGKRVEQGWPITARGPVY